MKIVIFTDLHVFPHRFGGEIDKSTGRQSRLQDCLDVLDATANLVDDIDAQHRLFIGDMFHIRGRLAPSFLNPVVEHFRIVHHGDWTERGADFTDWLIPGNHDMENRVAGENALQLLRSENVRVLDSYGITPMTGGVGDDAILGWVSYDPDVKTMKNNIKAVAAMRRTLPPSDRIKPGIFIVHHGIDGSMPNIPDCGIGTADLPTEDFDWCFCGDYHMHSELVSGKAWMVGAPMHHNFGDAGQKRGWMTLDTVTREVAFVENERSPKFVALDKLTPYTGDIKGNFFRLRHDNEAELNEWADKVEARGARAVQKELVRDWKAIERSEVEMSMTTEQMFKAWLKDEEVGDLDKTKIETLNRDILDEAEIS
jgi:DNA repair exonuclease SbcCD nuclease subunit